MYKLTVSRVTLFWKKKLKILLELHRLKKIISCEENEMKISSLVVIVLCILVSFSETVSGCQGPIKHDRKLMSVFIIFLATFGYLLKARSMVIEKNSQIIP